MPDILIRGMEMPHGCSICKLSFYDGEETVCPFCGAIIPSYSEREDSCPLHELPPHGDLVDIQNGVADAKFILFDDEPNDYQLGWNDGIDAVCHYAPVVVPAEKGE